MALPLLVGALGGIVTDGGWYTELRRPGFAPPGWLFGPVWTALYLGMGVAAWLVWRRAGFHRARVALALYALQLVFNALWSPIFFGLRAMGWAFVDIVLLAIAIVVTLIKFYRIDRSAGLLLVPYLLWVLFAGALNFSLWMLNP
jgi:tryptophan-rich sensory protein